MAELNTLKSKLHNKYVIYLVPHEQDEFLNSVSDELLIEIKNIHGFGYEFQQRVTSELEKRSFTVIDKRASNMKTIEEVRLQRAFYIDEKRKMEELHIVLEAEDTNQSTLDMSYNQILITKAFIKALDWVLNID